jgi:hypothetical protein
MDPQLAAMMVANAKKQAYSQEIVYETSGRATSSTRRRIPDTSNSRHLAMQAAMMKEAVANHESVQLQRVRTQRTGNLRSSHTHGDSNVLLPRDIESEILNRPPDTSVKDDPDDPDLSLDILDESSSSSSSLDQNEELPPDEEEASTSIEVQRQQEGDEELFRLTASPGRNRVPQGPLLTSDSGSEDRIFADHSPSHSPTPPLSPFGSSFRDEPLQYFDSPPKRNYLDMNIQQPVFTTATGKDTRDFGAFQEEEEDAEANNVSKHNTTLISQSSNDIIGFEDEDTLPEETSPSRKRSRRPSSSVRPPFEKDWMRRNRSVLIVSTLILLVAGISIGVRSLSRSNDAAQDNPPQLADNIKSNRTDDEISQDDEPTVSPTVSPTVDYSGLSRPELLFQLLAPISGQSSLLNPTTPQYAAFTWLVETDDPTILNPDMYLGKDNDQTFFEMVQERYIMALLYYSTNGQSWRNQYFMKSVPICNWNDGGRGAVTEGITCEATNDSKGYAIQEIVLDMNRLGGEIPSELGRLVSLRKLGLGSNSLVGTVPTELGHLLELTSLGLQSNYLVGSLPSHLGQLSKLEGFVACK